MLNCFYFSHEIEEKTNNVKNTNNLLLQAKALARNFRDCNKQLETERDNLKVFLFFIFLVFFKIRLNLKILNYNKSHLLFKKNLLKFLLVGQIFVLKIKLNKVLSFYFNKKFKKIKKLIVKIKFIFILKQYYT